jgi:hypothetical protein
MKHDYQEVTGSSSAPLRSYVAYIDVATEKNHAHSYGK